MPAPTCATPDAEPNRARRPAQGAAVAPDRSACRVYSRRRAGESRADSSNDVSRCASLGSGLGRELRAAASGDPPASARATIPATPASLGCVPSQRGTPQRGGSVAPPGHAPDHRIAFGRPRRGASDQTQRLVRPSSREHLGATAIPDRSLQRNVATKQRQRQRAGSWLLQIRQRYVARGSPDRSPTAL
jgi:hypothetical protein